MDNSYECILKKFAHYTINKPNQKKLLKLVLLFHCIVSEDIYINKNWLLQKQKLYIHYGTNFAKKRNLELFGIELFSAIFIVHIADVFFACFDKT